MKKLILSLLIIAVLISACGTDELKAEVQAAVDAYNADVASFNEKIKPYNEAVALINDSNTELQGLLDAAQEVINKGEEPYDPTTLDNLKTALSDAGKAKVSVPEAIEEIETISVPEEAKKSELEELKEQTAMASEELAGKVIPETPEVPDYSVNLTELKDAQ